jgi:hypothetical protein
MSDAALYLLAPPRLVVEHRERDVLIETAA